MIPVIVIAVIIISGAGILVYIGLRNPQAIDEKALQARLDELRQQGEQIDLEKIELSQPFRERIIYPIARSLGKIAVRFTPQKVRQSVATKLELAGTPAVLEPTLFLALQLIGLISFAGIVFIVFSIGKTQWPFSRVLLVGLIFGILGFYFPQLWISGKIARRQKDIRKALPDALDLLTICVEAGLGFDAALSKVSEKWETQLSQAFIRVIKEIQLGKLRREALKGMSDRIGIPELTSFVAAVTQSEQLGVSLAKVLRIQADQMRTKRRQLAEEEAHKAPIKMLIPMAFLIFPSLGIVLLTPAALKLIHSAIGNMFQ